eukprot:9844269-Prorocentrum_lima.AAC.1
MDRLMNDFKKNPAGPGAKLQSNRPGGSSSSMSSRTTGTGVRTDDSNCLLYTSPSPRDSTSS